MPLTDGSRHPRLTVPPSGQTVVSGPGCRLRQGRCFILGRRVLWRVRWGEMTEAGIGKAEEHKDFKHGRLSWDEV